MFTRNFDCHLSPCSLQRIQRAAKNKKIPRPKRSPRTDPTPKFHRRLTCWETASPLHLLVLQQKSSDQNAGLKQTSLCDTFPHNVPRLHPSKIQLLDWCDCIQGLKSKKSALNSASNAIRHGASWMALAGILRYPWTKDQISAALGKGGLSRRHHLV